MAPRRRRAIGQTFDSRIRPFLSKNCTGCHNAKLNTANLNLDSFADEASAAKKPELWDKVRDKLVTGKMPPPPRRPRQKRTSPPLRAGSKVCSRRSGYASDNPGRVVARRLNRVEYNNTIRDLLAVPIRPADEFPVDDSRLRFRQCRRCAVRLADADGKVPGGRREGFAAGDLRSGAARQADAAHPAAESPLAGRRTTLPTALYGVALPYSMRGAMYGTWVFPADAEYEFRLRIANFRGGDVVVNSSNGPGRRRRTWRLRLKAGAPRRRSRYRWRSRRSSRGAGRRRTRPGASRGTRSSDPRTTASPRRSGP